MARSTKEHQRLFDERYYAKHKSEISIKKKKYWKEHKLERSTQKKQHYVEHRIEICERQGQYHKEHKLERHLYNKKYRLDNQIKLKQHYLKKHYNITLDDYNALFETQKGCCAICGEHQKYFKRSFAVDHNHETGKIRGLLCSKCNTTLGNVHDDISILENAIKYLKSSQE